MACLLTSLKHNSGYGRHGKEARRPRLSAEDSGLFFAVCLSDRIIGYIGFHIVNKLYDLGYCFHSSHRGKGYAYESVKTLIEHFGQEHPGGKIYVGTALENTPSCCLLKRLGFICISTVSISFDGVFSFQSGNFILVCR